MATIKAYSDLQQSKKLAEFLPLDTADQCFLNDGTAIKAEINSYAVAMKLWKEHYIEIIPCWSLAALIEQMPSDIKGHELTIRKSYWQTEKTFAYELSYEENFEDYPSSILVSTSSIELIDACVEMVLKLKEKNLL